VGFDLLAQALASRQQSVSRDRRAPSPPVALGSLCLGDASPSCKKGFSTRALAKIHQANDAPAYENPIQRPPHATPNHRTNDMIAVHRANRVRSEIRSMRVTRR
jgi:hypothetical protein